MNNKRILIVDDEPDILELLDITLSRMGLDVAKADTLSAALGCLGEHPFDLCLTDMRLPDGDGIDLVEHIQNRFPHTPVAVITAFGSVETAISALKAGAFDFISKPIDLPQLRDMVAQALKIHSPDKQDTEPDSMGLIGNSPAIEQLRGQIHKLARSQAPVYISGESGSGKELVARMIHNLGPRSDQSFVPVNCGAIPTELMESEFFGHKKGSFTGAVTDKDGLFKSAHGGTLFLDEVADLPLHMQVKLLRAIQEKSVRPVGAQKETAVDVRILCATHKDLGAEVEAGNFRQDMYYRINVIETKVPSLRERSKDIPALTEYILNRLNTDNETSIILSDKALTALTGYSFPGNVRELENILERASTLCENNRIEVEDLQLNSVVDSESTIPANGLTLPAQEMNDDNSLDDYLEEIEKQAILKALEETRWNRTAAAAKLGISFRQMRHRLKKFGIE